MHLVGHRMNLKAVDSGNELILWARRSQLWMYLHNTYIGVELKYSKRAEIFYRLLYVK